MTECTLCPLNCALKEGQVGACKVRICFSGKIEPVGYGKISTLMVDRIVQKGLREFKECKVLSVGFLSCNLHCKFCQNHLISQSTLAKTISLPPTELVELALSKKVQGIAFTYSEPLLYYEYILDVAKIAQENHLDIVIKTNGTCNPEVFSELLPYVSAINIDVKGDSQTYREVCGADMFESVIRNLALAYKMCHTEVSMVLLPKYVEANRLEVIFDRVLAATGGDLPLHLLRFVPDYKMKAENILSKEDVAKITLLAKKRFANVYNEA